MNRYPKPLMAHHWITALAVVVAYATSGDPTHPKTTLDALIGQAHVISGITILILVGIRLTVRRWLGSPAPVIAPGWQRRAASALHVSLYALMFGAPLAGWAALSDKALVFNVAGFAAPLFSAQLGWASLLGNAHQALGNIFIALVGAHTAAALWHHFWKRDGTLARMAPWFGRRQK